MRYICFSFSAAELRKAVEGQSDPKPHDPVKEFVEELKRNASDEKWLKSFQSFGFVAELLYEVYLFYCFVSTGQRSATRGNGR